MENGEKKQPSFNRFSRAQMPVYGTTAREIGREKATLHGQFAFGPTGGEGLPLNSSIPLIGTSC